MRPLARPPRPCDALRRYFDDFRALARGARPPRADDAPATSPRASAATWPPTARSCAAKAATARRARARHHGARAVGRSLGSNADRLPAWRAAAVPAAAAGPSSPSLRRPVLFVTNHAPAFRSRRVRPLHEREDVVFALVGGRHAPRRRRRADATCRSRCCARPSAACSGSPPRAGSAPWWRACRAASRCPAAYAGARPAGVPFVLWATIWRIRGRRARALLPAAAAPLPPRRRGRHLRPARLRLRARQGCARRVSRRRRASTPRSGRRRRPSAGALPSRCCSPVGWAGEGSGVLLQAWARAACGPASRAGTGRRRAAPRPGRRRRRAVPEGPPWPGVRALFAGSDVVVVPSIATRDFLEPWGLVVNEAFHRGVPVVATDRGRRRRGRPSRHERTGLVVPPGGPAALAAAPAAPARRPGLRARLGAAARAVAPYTHDLGRGDGARAARPAPDARGAAASLRAPWSAPFWHHRGARRVLWPPPPRAGRTRTQILPRLPGRSSLRGDYTPRELRDARNNIPADIDQYSDCRECSAPHADRTATSAGGADAAGRRRGGGGATGGGGGGGAGGARQTASGAADRHVVGAGVAGRTPPRSPARAWGRERRARCAAACRAPIRCWSRAPSSAAAAAEPVLRRRPSPRSPQRRRAPPTCHPWPT